MINIISLKLTVIKNRYCLTITFATIYLVLGPGAAAAESTRQPNLYYGFGKCF